MWLVWVVVVAAVAALLLRFARVEGVQRQQLKWLTLATCLLGVIGLLNLGPRRGERLYSADDRRLLGELARFTGPGWEQEDDITLVTLRRLEAGRARGKTAPAGPLRSA